MTALTIALCLVGIDPNAGTAGFDFLRLTPTAREAAMGGAGIAAATGPLALWFSPALTTANPDPRAQVGYLSYVAGIHVGSAAYSQPVGSDKAVGFGLVYLNSGTMKRTNERGDELGTFGASYADANLSGALAFGEWTLGAGLRGLYGAIDTFFSLGVAGNLGATWAPPVNGLVAGLRVANLGYQVKAFQAGRDPLPLDFALGLGYSPSATLGAALDVHKPVDNQVNVRAGLEGWIADLLALRFGYNTEGVDLRSGGGLDILAGLSAGLGVRYRGYGLDYAFVPMVDLGVAHRLSLSFGL
jgi:hypothetical protein